jgi:hypothetical protein
LFREIRKTTSYGTYGEQLKFYNTFLLAFVKILVHATFSVKRKNFCGSNKKIIELQGKWPWSVSV